MCDSKKNVVSKRKSIFTIAAAFLPGTKSVQYSMSKILVNPDGIIELGEALLRARKASTTSFRR